VDYGNSLLILYEDRAGSDGGSNPPEEIYCRAEKLFVTPVDFFSSARSAQSDILKFVDSVFNAEAKYSLSRAFRALYVADFLVHNTNR
jgi:hypothetical protein